MQIAVKHSGIPLGSLIKLIFVGHGITSIIIAVIYSAIEFLDTGSKLASLSFSQLPIFAIAAAATIVLHVLSIALGTGFGLWLYSRWRGIEVYFLD